MTEEQRARLEEMAEWMARGDDGGEGSVLLDAEAAQEHSADLSALLATIARLEAEKVKDGEALSDGLYALESAAAVVLHLNGTTNRNREAAMTAIRARLSSRAKDQSQ